MAKSNCRYGLCYSGYIKISYMLWDLCKFYCTIELDWDDVHHYHKTIWSTVSTCYHHHHLHVTPWRSLTGLDVEGWDHLYNLCRWWAGGVGTIRRLCIGTWRHRSPIPVYVCVCVCVSVQSFIWDFCTNAVLKIVIDARWVASLADASCLYF